MSTESPVDNTPVTQNPRKIELTSPEFDIENKKNRIASETSDESDASESQTYTGNMASEHIEVMDIHDAVPPAGPTITIPPSEMLKLSELLKDTFHTEIVGIVDNIVKAVITGLQERITSLEKSNKDLQDTNVSLTARVTFLEAQADQAEQYSRRNCLRISGVPETPDESTDNIVMSIANDIDSDIRIHDIDRSHRVGNPKRKRGCENL